MCAIVYWLCHLVKATKVATGLAESNGSLPLSLWCDLLYITCGLTACTPGSAPGPTLGSEYGKTLPFLHDIILILVVQENGDSLLLLVKQSCRIFHKVISCQYD